MSTFMEQLRAIIDEAYARRRRKRSLDNLRESLAPAATAFAKAVMQGDEIQGSVTGRLHAFEPEFIDPPYGVQRTDMDFQRLAHFTFSQFDFASFELKIAQMIMDTNTLVSWVQGRNHTLKVRFVVDGANLRADYGLGHIGLGHDSRLLEQAGYRIETRHRRDYLDVPTGEVKRLRPRQVEHQIARAATLFYGNKWEGVEFDRDPLTTGGDTTVQVYAPSGHWAEGVAVCSPEDSFDKEYGRTLALSRALIKLNALVNGE